jgi:histidinol dehydrogenase
MPLSSSPDPVDPVQSLTSPRNADADLADVLPDRTPTELLAREPSGIDAATLSAAAGSVADVRQRGLIGLRAQAERFGDLAPGAALFVERPALLEALGRIPVEQRELLERSAQRIADFARAQKECLRPLDLALAGGRAGHDLVPLERVGCYAPGGRFPLPSTVLMTALVAKTAGVEQVTLASPKPSDLVLAAAALSGVERVLAVGGAQAIAALAYGVDGLEPVDFICGPGNRFVTAAKQLVFGRVGIDALAGPSELAVIADGGADPELVAADLLAQAEHDPDAWPLLIATDAALIRAVRQRLIDQLDFPAQVPLQGAASGRVAGGAGNSVTVGAPASNRAIARASLAQGGAVLVPNLIMAAQLADRLAPEHLALFVRDPQTLADSIRHAGAIFLGQQSSEVFGDYGFGPNHVLPTGRSARYRGGLSVFDFLRTRTWLHLTNDLSSPGLQRDSEGLAALEGLAFHAQAARLRLPSG